MSSTRIKKPAKKTLTDQFAALKNLPRFFTLIWQTHKGYFLSNILLRLLKAFMPLALLYTGKLIIDEVVRLANAGGEGDYTFLWTIVAIELGFAVLNDLLARLIALTDSILGDLVSNKTSIMLIDHASKLDLDYFEDAEFYDKLERARRQTVSRITLMTQVLGQLQDIITILFLAAGLIAFSPWLILLLIIAVIPSFLGESHFNERSYSLMYSWTPERRQLDYLRYTGASQETAKEVKIFGLSHFLTSQFKDLSDKFFLANKKLATKRAGWGITFSAIGTAGYYAAYVYIIARTVAGAITIGDLTFLAGSFARMKSMLENIFNRFSTIAEGALYLDDLFSFLELEPKFKSSPGLLKMPEPIQHGIEFRNVGFQYLNSDKWAVRNINFTFKAGEKIALVGENGAGKTTLVKLLARLYEPTEGEILLDGRNLQEYDPEELRKNIGVIFQDFVRFFMSASTNIAIGQIEEEQNRQRIEESAIKSLANDVIEKLPGKYEQVLGKRFSQGVELSGGEWQKIALARAYMRNAQILVLDEPTAALDARAEHRVFERFSELTQNKMAVLISHRFSTVRMADRILVLENGRLVEHGPHTQLLAQGGKYAELFTLQAAGYK